MVLPVCYTGIRREVRSDRMTIGMTSAPSGSHRESRRQSRRSPRPPRFAVHRHPRSTSSGLSPFIGTRSSPAPRDFIGTHVRFRATLGFHRHPASAAARNFIDTLVPFRATFALHRHPARNVDFIGSHAPFPLLLAFHRHPASTRRTARSFDTRVLFRAILALHRHPPLQFAPSQALTASVPISHFIGTRRTVPPISSHPPRFVRKPRHALLMIQKRPIMTQEVRERLFLELFHAHKARIQRLCYAYLGSTTELDDLFQEVRHPPQSGWLDELGRLKGGRAVGRDAARCASSFQLQNCPLPSAASCSRMYWRTCSSSNPTVDTA